MVNPFRRMVKWMRIVMKSRKRKSEMEPVESTSTLAEDDIDNGYPLPRKLNRSSDPDLPYLTAFGDTDSLHQCCAQVGPIVCNHQGLLVSIDDYKPVASLDKVNLKFACPCGDSCEDRLSTISHDKKVETGSPSIDRILCKLQMHGFHAQEHIRSGRYGSIVLSYSEREHKHVVLKFPLAKESRPPWAFCADHDKSEGSRGRDVTRDEVYIHDQLHHPNIVQLLSFQHLDGHTVLHLEYCEYGNLLQLLSSHLGRVISEGSARKYFRGLIEGLEYIHYQRVVHLDIRPENLLINNYNQLKISDFGDAGLFQAGDPLYTRKIGVIGYKAPENIEKDMAYNPRYVDIWAAGSVLYRLVSGSAPFLPTPTESSLDLMKKGITYISSGNRDLNDDINDNSRVYISPPLNKLLDKILQYVPESRCGITAIKADDWMNCKEEQVQISGVYMMRNVKKRGGDY